MTSNGLMMLRETLKINTKLNASGVTYVQLKPASQMISKTRNVGIDIAYYTLECVMIILIANGNDNNSSS